jgi:hypothetical protein
MAVYGIMGAKFSGKDTFARMVGNPYRIEHGATKLKNICSYVFNLSFSQFHDPDLKELLFDKPIHIDSYLASLQEATGLVLSTKNLSANSPRELLQYVGTDYVRSAKDSYWVDNLLMGVTEASDVLIPDTRFINEVEAIRSLGGKIIQIIRVDSLPSKDSHRSETESLTIKPDLIVGCVTGKFWLQQLIADLLRVGNWEEACLFDYRLQNSSYTTVNSIKNHYYMV